MKPASRVLGLVLGAAFALPVPGSQSRERGFCNQWLTLTRGGKHDVIVSCDTREAGAEWDAECREGLRPAVRHKLDAECRNWSRLMDFEVRAVLDGVLEPCRRKSTTKENAG